MLSDRNMLQINLSNYQDQVRTCSLFKFDKEWNASLYLVNSTNPIYTYFKYQFSLQDYWKLCPLWEFVYSERQDNQNETNTKTRAGVCKTLCPQQLAPNSK